jgi:DNA polymerase-3 subunit delta
VADLEPVYLIVGTDRPKVETAVSRLRRHFEPESIEHVSATDTTGAEVVALCNAGSLFGGSRLVIADDVDGRPDSERRLRNGWKAADVTAVTEYLSAPAPDTVLALVAQAMKKDAPLAKTCGRVGAVLSYDVARRGLQQWVAERFKALDVRAEPDACAALIHIVGDDLHALALEVEKIATWAGDEPVGEREVEHLVAATADTPVFAISDAWGRRDLARALEAAEMFVERSGRPVAATVPIVAGQLARQVGVVRRAKRLEEQGVRAKDALQELGVKFEFQAQRAFQFAQNFSEAELDNALVRLAELDHALKGGSRLAPDLELERALADVCRGDEERARLES